ncbi:MAG TPA: DEAD/DEAH box helicase, partial [Thermomicrobiales bacterium]|nr:DEAD/DEAH box helicase [Thermomicrobiales bacterium]
MAGVSATAVDATGARTRFDAIVETLPNVPGLEQSSPIAIPIDATGAGWREIAANLRTFLGARRVVTHDAGRPLAVLAAEGVRLYEIPVDTAELASILVPGLAAIDLATLADALGVSAVDGDSDLNAADAIADIFEALQARIAEYDDVTLDRLSLHVHEGGWPFADLFEHLQATGVRTGGHRRLLPPEIAFLRERPREEALEPTGSLEPLELQAVRDVIGPNGTLADVIAGFERRRQQEQMAEAVTEAINLNGQILVEAGTGTGKSLAYLVPAALAASERGETVVLSTNTLALQDQLLRK